MANALYAKARERFLAGDLDWDGDNIKIALIDTGAYTVNLATHQDMADVTAGRIKEATSYLAGKTVTNGVADANDYTWVDVTGATSEAIIIYKHDAADASAFLIAYIDSATSGLPVTPNGGDITAQWSSGSNKIFKL